MSTQAGFLLIAAVVAMGRFCHINVVWVEEAYPMAAAFEMARGKVPYRDFWFDKPPLFPALYWFTSPGWPLRVFGTAVVLLACWSAFLAARQLWGEREGLTAAGLIAFFLTFGIPSAVMAAAPDLLMIAPHLLAVWLAIRGRAFVAGLFCGVAMLLNTKAVFVTAACLLWQWRSAHLVVGGFVAAQLPALAWLWAEGALPGYWEQVWKWGIGYSADSPFGAAEGVKRSLNWLGFHAVLALGAAAAFRRDRRLAGWLLVSAIAVSAGWRFFPRYYFHLLAPASVMAAYGIRKRPALALLLLIPMVRFGPRYYQMATGAPWADLALHDDSRQAAGGVKGSLLVWGYRPEVFVYSGAPAGTPFLDSQPLTGVIADRHLESSKATYPELAARNRAALTGMRPETIVDGLGPLNPDLSIGKFADLQEWLRQYEEAGRTKYSVIYRLKPTSSLKASRALNAMGQ